MENTNLGFSVGHVLCASPYSSTSIMREALHGVACPHVVPAATVTTGTKPHGQQQRARDLEVERAVMGQLSASKFRRGAAMLSAVFRSTYSVPL